jgi:hypothetical protein
MTTTITLLAVHFLMVRPLDRRLEDLTQIVNQNAGVARRGGGQTSDVDTAKARELLALLGTPRQARRRRAGRRATDARRVHA